MMHSDSFVDVKDANIEQGRLTFDNHGCVIVEEESKDEYPPDINRDLNSTDEDFIEVAS
jgi:hypothetical protein